MKYVVFGLGDESYALPIEKVRSIETVTSIRPVPLSPPEVLGVINLRGVVTTIVDMRTMLNMVEREIDSNTRILIVEERGYLVDSAHDVIDCEESDIQTLEDQKSQFLRGVIKKDDRIIVLIEV